MGLSSPYFWIEFKRQDSYTRIYSFLTSLLKIMVPGISSIASREKERGQISVMSYYTLALASDW